MQTVRNSDLVRFTDLDHIAHTVCCCDRVGRDVVAYYAVMGVVAGRQVMGFGEGRDGGEGLGGGASCDGGG